MMPTLPSSSSSSCCISSTYYYCYLLRSVATKNSTASYIGFTTNPSNRLRQHNGEVTAGAQRTSKRRPWKFVCIVSGFPNKIVALQFEWQWQHMHRSRLFKSPSKPSTTATTTTATAITVSTTTTSTSPLTKKNVSRKKSSNRSPGGVSIVEEANNQTNDHENNAIPLKIRRKRKRILTPHNHTKYTGKLYLLSQLLNHPIWKQLQLIVYFLDPEIEKPFYQYLPKQQFSICEMSMDSITSLQSEIKKKTKGSDSQLMDQKQTLNSFCLYCNQTISSSSLSFLGNDAVPNSSQRVIRSKNNQNDEGSNQSMNNPVPHRIWKCPHCCYSHHLLCTAREAVKILSNSSSSSSEALQDVPLIPLTGKCENCHCKIKWPDIIRKYLLPMTSSSFTLHHSQNGNLSDGDSSGSSETSDDEEDEEQILDEDDDDEDEDLQSGEERRMDELPEAKRLKRTSKNVILIEDEALNGEDGPFHSPVEARFNSNLGALLLDEDDYLYHEAHHQNDYYFSEENY